LNLWAAGVKAKYGGERVDIKSFEVKASEDERGVIHGYAAVFNNLDRHRDILKPGSLKHKTVKVPLLWNHDTNAVIGHAILTEDKKGFAYKGVLAVNSQNEDLRREAERVYAMIKEGHVDRNSFGFIVEDDEYVRKDVDGKPMVIRHIKKVDVAEVSIVPAPANPKAGVTQIKSADYDKIMQAVEDKLNELKGELIQAKSSEQKSEHYENPWTKIFRRY
jgi:uncharacterized protein